MSPKKPQQQQINPKIPQTKDAIEYPIGPLLESVVLSGSAALSVSGSSYVLALGASSTMSAYTLSGSLYVSTVSVTTSSILLPQFSQNLAPSASGAPQCLHVIIVPPFLDLYSQ